MKPGTSEAAGALGSLRCTRKDHLGPANPGRRGGPFAIAGRGGGYTYIGRAVSTRSPRPGTSLSTDPLSEWAFFRVGPEPREGDRRDPGGMEEG